MTNFGKVSIDGAIWGFILLAVYFKVVAVLVPEVSSSAEELGNLSQSANETVAYPLASFFTQNGLVILVIMAAIILAVIKFLGIGKSR